MSQTSVIFGALFLGFVVYVTLKGHLATYFNLLFTSGQSLSGMFPNTPNTPQGMAPQTTSTLGPDAGAIFTSAGAGQYMSSLPQEDQGLLSGLRSDFTGYYPSGLPSVPTLRTLTSQATANLSGGAAL